MNYYKLIIIIFLLSRTLGFAQNSELGLIGGTSYYLGELNPAIQLANKVKPTVGIYYRKNTNTRYALRFGASYAKLASSDQFSSTELSQYRQLSFATDLWEAYGVLEFNFLPYQISNYRTSSFTPYVFIGAAVFSVNPNVVSNGMPAAATKGMIITPSMPFGLGFKFNFLKNIGLGIEWGMRKTLTDQIDGLSETHLDGYQLSNTQNKDWYSILGISLNYKFLTDDDRCRGVVN